VEKVKETKEFKIFKKGSGRYCVTDAKNKWINGDKKVEILTQAGLLKTPPKKKAAPAPAAEEAPVTTEQ
jgi:hypothetical protein